MTPTFELGRDSCTMHLPQVLSSDVYSFGSCRVDIHAHKHHTNKQTPLKTSNVLRYATTLGNDDDDDDVLLAVVIQDRHDGIIVIPSRCQ